MTKEELLSRIANGEWEFPYVDLQGMDLQEENLECLVLYGANLQGANLRYTNLMDADLRGANLQNTDLREALLQGTIMHETDLRGANIEHTYLDSADLSGAIIDFQIEEGLMKKIARIIVEDNSKLYLEENSANSLAVWACMLAKNGKELEEKYGTEVAGLLLLGEEAQSFYYGEDVDIFEWLENF